MVLRIASKEVTSFSDGANPFGRLLGKPVFQTSSKSFSYKAK